MAVIFILQSSHAIHDSFVKFLFHSCSIGQWKVIGIIETMFSVINICYDSGFCLQNRYISESLSRKITIEFISVFTNINIFPLLKKSFYLLINLNLFLLCVEMCNTLHVDTHTKINRIGTIFRVVLRGYLCATFNCILTRFQLTTPLIVSATLCD